MWLRGCLLAPFLLCCCFVIGDIKFYERKGEQIYEYLNDFRRQRIDQINPFRIPLLILPVIIVPSINLQDDDTISQTSTEENQDININKISTPKFVANITESDDDNDIEINFRQSLNRGTKVPKREVSKIESTAKQSNDILYKSEDDSSNNEVNITVSIFGLNKTQDNVKNDILNITEQNSIYPVVTNTNTIEPLKLTIVTNDEFTLLPNSDNGWMNFTQITHASVIKENKTSLSENSNSLITGANANKAPYSASLYKNTMIDQVSITTNSHTNLESPPIQNDRWMRFTSLKRSPLKTAGFRPLAGLYYDGFLHSPLIKMPTFIPYNNNHYH